MHRDKQDLLDLDELGWIGTWRFALCMTAVQRLNAVQFDPQLDSLKCKCRGSPFIENYFAFFIILAQLDDIHFKKII